MYYAAGFEKRAIYTISHEYTNAIGAISLL